MIKVLIADDHALVREGLRAALAELVSGVEVEEAADAEQVIGLLQGAGDWGLILLDLRMPGAQGFTLVSTVCNLLPDVPVVVLSATDDGETMRRALDCGVCGYIPKATPREVMLQALRLVLAGGVYVPRSAVSHESPGERSAVSMAGWQPGSAGRWPNGHLTDRQQQVLELLGQGLQNKQIARRLTLSEHTVKIHVTAILDALGVSNRTQAVVAAQKLGLAGVSEAPS